MNTAETKERLTERAKNTKHDLKPWMKIFARIGFMTKGFVFILVGVLSLLAAAGIGGKAKGTSGAIEAVAMKPFGEVLLWLIAVGLLGYIIWLLIKIFEVKSLKKNEVKGWTTKAGDIISCVIYIGIAYKAFSFAIHAGSTGDSKQTWTAMILATDVGPWLIGLIGLGIIANGIFQIYSGWKEKFMSQFKVTEMSDKEVEAAKKSGKIGFIARGLIFGFLGYFVTRMAITSDPDNPKGLDEALQKLLQQDYGSYMLGIVSIGLAFYGMYEILKGKNKYLDL